MMITVQTYYKLLIYQVIIHKKYQDIENQQKFFKNNDLNKIFEIIQTIKFYCVICSYNLIKYHCINIQMMPEDHLRHCIDQEYLQKCKGLVNLPFSGFRYFLR
jgi:hypothetical protein